jgi:hypothetical protein
LADDSRERVGFLISDAGFLIKLAGLGFVPIAWLCVLKNIDTVYLPLIMTLLLGFTNGCLGSAFLPALIRIRSELSCVCVPLSLDYSLFVVHPGLCMMYAPQQCSVHEQELAGTVMVTLPSPLGSQQQVSSMA